MRKQNNFTFLYPILVLLDPRMRGLTSQFWGPKYFSRHLGKEWFLDQDDALQDSLIMCWWDYTCPAQPDKWFIQSFQHSGCFKYVTSFTLLGRLRGKLLIPILQMRRQRLRGGWDIPGYSPDSHSWIWTQVCPPLVPSWRQTAEWHRLQTDPGRLARALVLIK